MAARNKRTGRKRNSRAAARRAAPNGILTLVGKELRRQRKKKNLTQVVLGIKAGYSENVVGLIERGIYNPTIVMLNDIATYLGIPVADLFTDIDSMKSWPGFNRETSIPTSWITELRWRRV